MFFCSTRRRLNRIDHLFHLITTAFELYVKREINMSTPTNPLDAVIADIAVAEGSLETRLQGIIDTLKANQNDPAAVAAEVAKLQDLKDRMNAFNAPAPEPTPAPETPAA